MQTEDFAEMAAAMAQSLQASDALAGRGPSSPPWVISIDKVRNLSSDVMTRSEQWAVMRMIRGAQPIQTLRDRYNVRFVLAPERAIEQRQSSESFRGPGFGQDRRVTHTMIATFRSVTRASSRQRTELYSLGFELLPIDGGSPVWVDRFEFQRQAAGHIWN